MATPRTFTPSPAAGREAVQDKDGFLFGDGVWVARYSDPDGTWTQYPWLWQKHAADKAFESNPANYDFDATKQTEALAEGNARRLEQLRSTELSK